MALIIPKSIKMIITDFDGIFTDNSVYVNEDKTLSRRLSFKDLMGVSLLKKNGYDVAVISGETNSAIQMMQEKFLLAEVHQSIRIKIDVLKGILNNYALSLEEVLFIGDDVNDIECLNYVKTKITVPNANKKVKEVERIQITSAIGGDGAFREVVDSILYS